MPVGGRSHGYCQEMGYCMNMELQGAENDKALNHYIELMYPKKETTVEIGMCHVRAADSIKINYDFDRDGWSIKQASTFQWAVDDLVCDQDWQEVAFIAAWAREKDQSTIS